MVRCPRTPPRICRTVLIAEYYGAIWRLSAQRVGNGAAKKWSRRTTYGALCGASSSPKVSYEGRYARIRSGVGTLDGLGQRHDGLWQAHLFRFCLSPRFG